jgi:hypothetical protein
MFEQSIFESEPVNEPTPELQDGDLFQNYELRSWVPSPRLYKILGASALANILVLLVFSQTSLLTAKGCDSPLVGSVCQVLDTVYIGSLLLGTKREYADAAYDRTELADADITYIELPPEGDKLSYPDGYFQIANPEMFVAKQDPTNSGFPQDINGFPNIPTMRPNPANSLLNTPPVYPKQNKTPIIGDDLPTLDDNPTVGQGKPGLNKRKPGSGTPSNVPDRNPDGSIPGIPGSGNANTNGTVGPNNPTIANKTEDQGVEDRNGMSINGTPIKDTAAETIAQIDAGSVKLDQPFRVVITGTLGLAKDGKTIVLKNPKPAPPDKNFPSDPALTKLAQEWVVAVGDAGWYGYLGVMDEKKGVGRKVVITVEQNDTTFVANLRSEQPTPERADTTATSLRNFMSFGALAAKGDELEFLTSTTTNSDGKFLIVNFEMKKPQVQELIQRKLAETKEKQAQPNSTAVVGPQNKSAGK